MKDWAVTGKTAICGVIGDPIAHTVSPAMHNAAFRALRLDYVYVPFHVREARLGDAIAGMRALDIKGLNVTIPHKVAVMKLLDKLEPLAEQIGAVNTIINSGGKLTGDNTDASGFIRALHEKGVAPEGKRAVIIGAGGAARAIAFALASCGASMVILNRIEELNWAQQLAARVAPVSGQQANALELNGENLARALDSAELVVNATPVGMSPHPDASPIPTGLLRSGIIVFDSVYNPSRTRLLREAREAGAITVGGLDMLVWQGALAFEKWTGMKAPVEQMREAGVKALGLTDEE